MIIDETMLRAGITGQLAAKLIEHHEKAIERYERLRDYYNGRHGILGRSRPVKGAPNHQVVCNHAKYIVDMAQSYLTGNPVQYEAAKGFDIEALKNAYLEQEISSLDSELVKGMGIYGRAYELVYANEDSKPRSVQIPPQNAFVCYSQSAERRPLLGVHYYRKYDLDGRYTGIVCNIYDDSFVYTFEGNQSAYSLQLQTELEPHRFLSVPLIEYQNNQECQGDFEQLIPLINAYNTLMSDRVNDKEEFVDAFLFLRGVDLDSTQARKLKREKILMGEIDSEAKYLSKAMNETDVKVLRDDLKEDIHRFSMVPDLSDESFGNNLSGVSIKYKLLCFEQQIKNKERYFAKSLKARFRLYNDYLSAESKMQEVPGHRVDIVFTHNLPANELEIAQMVNYLKGTASDVTLLSQLPFVTDAEEEYEIAQGEKENAADRERRRYDDLTDAGGYNRTLDNLE